MNLFLFQRRQIEHTFSFLPEITLPKRTFVISIKEIKSTLYNNMKII